MNNRAIAIAAAALSALLSAGVADAKTLVYCSEGSPENFNPMLNITGTTFDANLPIYNRLVEFKLGTTEIGPGLAESWDVVGGRQGLHLPSAQERASGIPTSTSSRPATSTPTT